MTTTNRYKLLQIILAIVIPLGAAFIGAMGASYTVGREVQMTESRVSVVEDQVTRHSSNLTELGETVSRIQITGAGNYMTKAEGEYLERRIDAKLGRIESSVEAIRNHLLGATRP